MTSAQIARKWREALGADARSFRKVARFLSHSNRSDPEAKAILRGMRETGGEKRWKALVRRMDLWAEGWGEGGARWPTDREWNAILSGKLDGKCGMSDDRQWRHRYSLDSLVPI